VRRAWAKGDRLAPKTTFHNNRELQPNGIRYTKPILMLVDEMSGSGGDAFPAMLQGMQRAKLMGVRTMGAGGHVQAAPGLNYSSNRLNLTKSLFYRPDGVAVENNGAVPDIAYQPTRDDFLYKYKNYQNRYLEELEKLIP
jgi:C-terminal processing protease CtpA/Prc